METKDNTQQIMVSYENYILKIILFELNIVCRRN